MALAQLFKNTSTYLCIYPNTSITKGKNWSTDVNYNSFILWLEFHWKQQILGWHKIREVNPLMLGWQWQTSIRLQMPSLVKTMSTRQHEELNVFEGNTCTCFHPTWKSTSHTMAIKVLQITSWILVCLLPWAQHKRWIPIGLMGCVHTHQRIPAIKGWGNPSCIQSAMEKIGEANRKLGKTSRIITKHLPWGYNMKKFEHDGFHIPHQIACWKGYDGADILVSNLEVEPFVLQWVVQKKENMCELEVIWDHMLPRGVVGKGKCYCRFMLRFQEGMDVDQP